MEKFFESGPSREELPGIFLTQRTCSCAFLPASFFWLIPQKSEALVGYMR